MRLVKYWIRFPREVVNAPSLQTYKARLGGDRWWVLVYSDIHSFLCLSIISKSDLWWQLPVLLCKCNWSLIWKNIAQNNDRFCVDPLVPLKEGNSWPHILRIARKTVDFASNITEVWERKGKRSSNSKSTMGGESSIVSEAAWHKAAASPASLLISASPPPPPPPNPFLPQDEPNSNFCRANPSQG